MLSRGAHFKNTVPKQARLQEGHYKISECNTKYGK